MTTRFMTSLVGVAVVVTTCVVGCGSSDEPDAFDLASSSPSLTGTATESPTPSETVSPTSTFSAREQEVIVAVNEYWACEAEAFRRPEKAYDLLAGCAKPPISQTLPRAINKIVESGRRSEGEFSNHVYKKPKFVSNGAAEVYDCLDASQIKIVNQKNGEVTFRGTNPASLTVRLEKVGEEWKVREIIDHKEEDLHCVK